MEVREKSAQAYAEKCKKFLDEAEESKGKILEEIHTLQEKLHAQGLAVIEQREKYVRAKEDVAKIKDEIATAARDNVTMAKGGDESEAAKPMEDDAPKDKHFLQKLKGISEEELQKYGLTFIGNEKEKPGAETQKAEEGEGQGPPKESKLTIEDFDDLMAESWKANLSMDKDGTLGSRDNYDQWAEEFKKGHKYSPY